MQTTDKPMLSVYTVSATQRTSGSRKHARDAGKSSGKTAIAARAAFAPGDALGRVSEVNPEVVKAAIAEQMSALKTAFSSAPTPVAGLDLDSISVALTISATGTVSIFGSGGSVMGEASITVTFSRPK